jgi:phosphoribosylglycinamide formyltransferase-1
VLRLAVLVSGGGTNLQAILDAIADGSLDARVTLVLSNRADAFALERARRAGVPTRVVAHKSFASREEFDGTVVEAVRASGADWVVLAGFMRIVTAVLLDAFQHRVLNVHPALLPAFPGAHAQAQALAYGVKFTGCTVHFVDAGMDTGPIIAQAVVPVGADDTVESLSGRLLAEEHRLLPEVLRWVAAGRVSVERGAPGERARVRIQPTLP